MTSSLPGQPGVNFGQSESGLFSGEEIRRLMDIEFARSQRYEYPLTLLLIEIDRLESLHDLYGVDSRERIVRSVRDLLRKSTRGSDALGCLHDQRLLVLLPHTPCEGATVIARRVLTGCRTLEFRGDGRVLRATLSIGAAQRTADGDFAQLVQAADEALAAAVRAGGDRCQEYERLPRREPVRVAPAGVAAALPQPPPARARTPVRVMPALPGVGELAGETLEEKVGNLFRWLGEQGFGAPSLETAALEAIQSAITEVRGRRATREEVEREIRALEGRMTRLRQMVEASEEELARMVTEKSVDPGIASIYRTVQGLDPQERNYSKKKELLSVLYKANVELLRELERERDALG